MSVILVDGIRNADPATLQTPGTFPRLVATSRFRHRGVWAEEWVLALSDAESCVLWARDYIREQASDGRLNVLIAEGYDPRDSQGRALARNVVRHDFEVYWSAAIEALAKVTGA